MKLDFNIPNLLTHNDPSPINIDEGSDHFIFTGPHNGHAVPENLDPSLGTDPDWFANAHEASDLHVEELFQAMKAHFQESSFVSAYYSRLVCDLNRMPDFSITESSSEFANFKIPDNQAQKCCQVQRSQRINEIFNPYHEAKADLVDRVRERNGGAIVLDIHSFSPTWEEVRRDVEIGTIRCEKTPLSKALEGFLKEQTDFRFVSGEPYRVAERPSSAAPFLTHTNDLQYIGLEIRNDLIATPEGIDKVIEFLKSCVNHLNHHPDFETLASPRREVMPHDFRLPSVNPGFSI